MSKRGKSVLGLSLLLLAGCRGLIGDPGGDPEDPRPTAPVERPDTACDLDLGPAELRRLSHEQYLATLRDLFGAELGATVAAAAVFPETRVEEGFVTDAAANNVNESESNRIEDNAAALASLIVADPNRNLPALMGCVSAPVDDAQIDGCIDAFIDGFGSRAFRRPLADEERAMVRDLYDATRDGGAVAALQSVLELVLMAPPLLYQIERGVARVEGRPELIQLSGHELASRLSYFLWGSMPDDALFEAAESGALASPSGVATEARRMVADARALTTLSRFHRDLTRSHRLGGIDVEDPAFTEAVREALLAEGERNLEVWGSGGTLTFAEVFGARTFVVDPALAGIYGVSVSGEPSVVELPDRRGLLGQASVLTALAHDHGKNPTVMRGLYVLENVLCQSVPPFPDNLDVAAALDETAGRETARDRLSPTETRSDCRSCHSTINVAGFGLESYDALGRFRTEENGAPIDASGTLALDGAEGSFADGPELLEMLSTSELAQACYARQLYRFAIGRRESAEDECTVTELGDRFVASGGDIRELLVAITTTDAFRFRVLVETAP